jgi:hypothetical protein
MEYRFGSASLITPYVAYWIPEHFGGPGATPQHLGNDMIRNFRDHAANEQTFLAWVTKTRRAAPLAHAKWPRIK